MRRESEYAVDRGTVLTRFWRRHQSVIDPSSIRCRRRQSSGVPKIMPKKSFGVNPNKLLSGSRAKEKWVNKQG